MERALHEALMRRLASRPRPTGVPLCLNEVLCKAGYEAYPGFVLGRAWSHLVLHSQK